MFARFKFDNLIGCSLQNAGMTSEEALDFWPIGRTKLWIKEGKRMGWPPHDAAMRSLFAFVLEHLDSGEIPEDIANHILGMCIETGKALNVQSKTIIELSEVLDNLLGN